MGYHYRGPADVLFGIAEVITGFTHNFIGILSTSQGTIPASASATAGTG
jgi:hypothetical protein